MLTIKARVHRGRLRLDEPYDAPEGTEVHLAVMDDGDSLDDEDRARLHAALAASRRQIARGEGIPAAKVLAKLRTKRK